MVNTNIRKGSRILGSFIDAVTWDEALEAIARWADAGESRQVCICNVHVVATARKDQELSEALKEADMATPDGMPLAWLLRQEGFIDQERINGPDFMARYCELAARTGRLVFFYGSTEETLEKLQDRLLRMFPGLRIAGMHSPPFRPISSEEDEIDVREINASGASVVFVGIGCPKQELWMAQHKGRVKAVMIGVGAAFDFHAGTVKRAPVWMQERGLEWLYRLMSEPRRLWKRYLTTNMIFVFHYLNDATRKTLANLRVI